nr:integrase, catalytic region, zinc finger, CCHC-type, peptidase aspartic, catalytic [Tanacetum cinerariifolium]
MKTEALKEQAKAAKLVKALTVYPPNTPVKLVPRVLPTKSQVKINIFALIQLFSEFKKTCKKRITPTGLTEGERGLNKQRNVISPRALDFQITQLTEKVLALQEQNKLFRVENAKIKQHYKELYDSIKITHAKHIDQTTALLTENENLKVQIKAKIKCVTIDSVTPKVLAPGMYVIDVEPIPPRLRNNRKVHLDFLKHLKESVATLREIVEEAKFERPLDRSVASACLYTKHSQKLLEYMIGTCFDPLASVQLSTPVEGSTGTLVF